MSSATYVYLESTFLWGVRDDKQVSQLSDGAGDADPALDGTGGSPGLYEEALPARIHQLEAVGVTVRVPCQRHLSVVELQPHRDTQFALHKLQVSR